MTQIKHDEQGFTMVEMMIVLAIIAILTSLVGPSFDDLIRSSRMTTQYNELLASLSLARSEAVKRDSTVTICKSNNHTTPACGGDWHNGWIIFADDDNDGVFDVGSDELVYVHAALSGDNTLDYARDRITFSGSGITSGGFNGTFTLCDDRGDSDSVGLIVSLTGRARHAIDTDVLAACPT